jgi:phosphoglycerate dehydrogenase-like enzyme
VSAQPAPVIVVTEPLNDRTLKYLAEHGQLRRVSIDDLPAHIAEADALIVRTYTQVDEALLSAARRLKVVGRAGVALENVDLDACRRRGIQVVHTPAANTLAVVDYTIAMILQMNRRFWPMTGPVSAEEFHKVRKQTFGRYLKGVTLGIIGCGRIGSRVGRAAVGLGMTVLVNDIIPLELDYPAEVVDKPALYARSDIVTIHVPLTRLTRRLICAETLRQFKPGAQFINCARGPCVNYADLAAAIRSGQVAAAAIDCHDPEPPPPDYPLFGLDNVILTPHVAARVPAAVEAMCDVVYDVVAVLEGRPPAYPAEDEDEG